MPPLRNLEIEFPIIDANFQRFCACHGILSGLLSEGDKVMVFACLGQRHTGGFAVHFVNPDILTFNGEPETDGLMG